jgi:Flp pilus assembly pilin Flp
MGVSMACDQGPARQHRCPTCPLGDERGSTAIEYALLASLLAIMAIGGLRALASGTGGLYDALAAITAAIEAALGR